MATRKKTAPKATEVLETQQTPQAKRAEALSFFLLEGERLRVEGAPEVLEHLTLKLYLEDGQGTTHLLDVVADNKGEGTFEATVPEVYKDEDPEYYNVCGFPIRARSFTSKEYFEWLEISKDKKLSSLQAELQKIRLDIRKANANTATVESATERLPSFQDAHKRLVAEEKKDPFAFAKSGQEDDLKLAVARINEFKAIIDEGTVDPIVQLEQTGGKTERWEEIERINREAQLEFIHRLAKREGVTTEEFSSWLERATGEDFSNTLELMDQGNDFWLYGQDADPLSRRDRRKLLKEVNQVVRNLKRETIKLGKP